MESRVRVLKEHTRLEPRGKSKVFIVVCAAVRKCGEKPAVIENGEARYNLNTGIMLHVFSLLWKYFISLLSVVTC